MCFCGSDLFVLKLCCSRRDWTYDHHVPQFVHPYEWVHEVPLMVHRGRLSIPGIAGGSVVLWGEVYQQGLPHPSQLKEETGSVLKAGLHLGPDCGL